MLHTDICDALYCYNQGLAAVRHLHEESFVIRDATLPADITVQPPTENPCKHQVLLVLDS